MPADGTRAAEEVRIPEEDSPANAGGSHVRGGKKRGELRVEIWDAYDADWNRIEGKTLVRGRPIPEGIFHLVADVLVRHTDGSYLLISRYALDCKPYKTPGTETNWDKSLLRFWLNEEFFIRAFNSGEQESIALSLVAADNGEIEGYEAGTDTMDKVFVFGFSQSLKYLSDSDWEFCAPTAFAAANGVKQSEDMEVDGKGACWYWLRSVSANHIAYHSPGPGFDVNAAGVRPVIWAYVKP